MNPIPDHSAPPSASLHRWLAGASGLLAFAALTVLLAGCGTSHSKFSPDTATAAAAPGGSAPTALATTLPLREGDLIKLSSEEYTNLNAIAPIQLEGFLNAPLVGEIKAAGKTIEELKADLKKRYETIIKVNDLNVQLYKNAAYVTISGAVLKPGQVQLDRTKSLLEAVMEAGGCDPNRAKPAKVTVMRLENGEQKIYHVDLDAILKGKSTEVFYLKPFDIVNVPAKRFNL